MSQLLAIIDEYKDAHGAPSDSSIARAIGVAPQTISSWRKRGIRQAPDKDTLVRLAELVGYPYEDWVLQAVEVDTGYRDAMPEPAPLVVSMRRSQIALRSRRGELDESTQTGA